jgi:hypothetical protein
VKLLLRTPASWGTGLLAVRPWHTGRLYLATPSIFPSFFRFAILVTIYLYDFALDWPLNSLNSVPLPRLLHPTAVPLMGRTSLTVCLPWLCLSWPCLSHAEPLMAVPLSCRASHAEPLKSNQSFSTSRVSQPQRSRNSNPAFNKFSVVRSPRSPLSHFKASSTA